MDLHPDGDVHVATAEPVHGSRGEIELVVHHTPEELDERREHRFVYRYEYDEARTPEGFTHTGSFVSWRSGDDRIDPETFLPLSHVEQYLHHYGMSVDPTLAPGMYPMINVTDGEAFSDDTELDVEIPSDG